MIQTVLFDLDGTLLDRDTSLRLFIENQYERFYEKLCHIPRPIYIERFIELDAHGYVWKDKVYQQLTGELEITSLSWRNLLSDYENEFHHSCISYSGLLQMLDALQNMGLKVGIVTNGRTEFQLKNIQALGITHFFSVILVSEKEGVRKPDSEIFMRALQVLKLVPKECVFIGDHPSNDIRAAQNVGMKAVWKRNPLWLNCDADAVVDELSQVPEILQEFMN